MKLPHGQGVVRALRSVGVATKRTLKGLNQTAAKRMGKGDYAGAEMLAAKGREIAQFRKSTGVASKMGQVRSGYEAGKAHQGRRHAAVGLLPASSEGDCGGWR